MTKLINRTHLKYYSAARSLRNQVQSYRHSTDYAIPKNSENPTKSVERNTILDDF